MAAGPQLVDITTLCRVLDLSERQIHELVKRGVIPRAARGRYDAPLCLRLYLRHLREIAAGRQGHPGGGVGDLVAQRARRERLQADRIEMQNAAMRGDLVPADEIEAAHVAVHSAVQKRLLAVPKRVAPLVAVENEARACEAIIRQYIEEALQAVADLEVVSDSSGARDAPDDAEDRRGAA